MTGRVLDIAVIFPDRSDAWTAGAALLAERLAPHRVRVAYGFGNEQVLPVVAEAEVVLTFHLTDESVAHMRKLRWIQGLGAGADGFLALANLPPATVVTSSKGIHGPPVAEAALSMMLALARNLPVYVRLQAEQRWAPTTPRLLHGGTVGILGTGTIAQALAGRCKAMGMQVTGFSREAREMADFDRIHSRALLRELAPTLDYLVLVAPLDDQTQGIVDASVLGNMQRSAFLVNVGRGGLVVEADLLAALDAGTIAGAALDTVSEEPLPRSHPLWKASNLLITPHVGGRFEGYMDSVLEIFEHNLRCYLGGDIGQMRNPVQVAKAA